MTIEDILVHKIDKELHQIILGDMINGSIWEMDDETLDIALTSMWEVGIKVWERRGIIVGEA
jgi:hypothetical protein